MPFVTVLKMFVNNFPSKCFSEHNAGYRRSSPDPRMLRTPSLLPALHRHLPRDEVGVCGGIFEHEPLHCSREESLSLDSINRLWTYILREISLNLVSRST